MTDRERVKQASKSLLASLLDLIRPMDKWTEKAATQAEVRVFILDNLYRALPRPPSMRRRLRKLPVGYTTTCGNKARAARTCSRREISGISQPEAACVASRAPTFRTLSDTQCANIGAIPAGASIARYAAYLLRLSALARFSRNPQHRRERVRSPPPADVDINQPVRMHFAVDDGKSSVLPGHCPKIPLEPWAVSPPLTRRFCPSSVPATN